MGSFLSSFSSINLADDLELQPLSKKRTPITRYSGRSHPLSPIGHSNLLTPSFRRRLCTSTNTQTQVQVMESPTGANYSADDPGTSATTPTDSASDELDELTTFNIEERDHTIAQLRKELKELDTQLRVAKKEIKTLKEHLWKLAGDRRTRRG